MDRAYAEPIELADVAARAHCSRFHFLRSFRAAYGETPRAYLTRRRIERAKDLLRSANLTVTEVSFLVGFTSLGSFSTWLELRLSKALWIAKLERPATHLWRLSQSRTV